MGQYFRGASLPGLALIVALSFAGCDAAQTALTDGRQLVVTRGVALEVTDTAVIVDGSAEAGLTAPPTGLLVHHADHYDYGGLGSYAPDRVREEQWFSRLAYPLPTVERGDTLVFEYLDFGRVTLAGTDTMLKATEAPDVSHAPRPIEYVSFVIYLATHYAWRVETTGAELTLVEASWLRRLTVGSEIAIRATGAERTAGFDTTFAIRPVAALSGVDNGGALDFRTRRPVIDADRALGLSFDGTVDPETTLFALLPWHEAVQDPARRRAGTLVGRLPAATDRAVIPASALTALLDGAGVDEAGYVLYIIRIVDTGHTLRSTRLDTGADLELGVGQVDDTRLLIRLTR